MSIALKRLRQENFGQFALFTYLCHAIYHFSVINRVAEMDKISG